MLRNACTIHENVYSAKFANCLVYHRSHVLRNSNIRLQCYSAPTLLAYPACGPLRIVDIEIRGRDVATIVRKSERDGLAKANAGTGNQCDAPAKIKQFTNSCG